MFFGYADIVNNLLKKYSNEQLIFLIILLFLLAINDTLRPKWKSEGRALIYDISCIISILLVSYVNYKTDCKNMTLYLILLLIELMVLNVKISVPLLLTYIICFFMVIIPNYNFKIRYLEEKTFVYATEFILIYLFRNIITEKRKTEIANKELAIANEKIKVYSARAQELAIAKERTNIAQELHDSIGHSLIALSMNLEYVENIIDKKPDKAKEVIQKSYQLSRDSISDLRKAVNILKERATMDCLRLSINDLFHNFKASNKVHFKFTMNDNLENLKVEVKDCIYKTVREGITNGIKHGKAENFIIALDIEASNILINIYNDGKSCNNIVKSNGLIGIENRITNVNGTVEFYSKNQKGFTIRAVIPRGDDDND